MKSLKIKDKIWVQAKGRLYWISSQKKSRFASQEEEQELCAPFSCKVLKVHAKSGASLKKGDPVVVVEAMKMEYSYAAPKDCVVEKILVKEGEILSAGAKFLSWKEKA